MSSKGMNPFEEIDLASASSDQIMTALVNHGVAKGASDLHVLTGEQGVRLMMRWLGKPRFLGAMPHEAGRRLISHVKALSDMDIAENRRPQDGRCFHESDGKVVDLRVNIIPVQFGEDVNMTVLDRDLGLRPLVEIGMTPTDFSRLKSILDSSSGLILVTGPTGAGKTTTLYSCLEHLKQKGGKINTIEDPIEFTLANVCQSQVDPRIKLDFAMLLRSILRQNPDVIMIGEVRDPESAAVAVRAANSGHLVFATLHAPRAAGAVEAMLALGVQPFFLANTLVGVVAQRLVRTLCEKCRVAYDVGVAPETFTEIADRLKADEGKTIYGPSGCESCLGLGYAGRTGVFEIMTFNSEIREMVSRQRPSAEIHSSAESNGMYDFRKNALLKVAQGITSAEEIIGSLPGGQLGLDS
jgi:general secretion pathway protein E